MAIVVKKNNQIVRLKLVHMFGGFLPYQDFPDGFMPDANADESYQFIFVPGGSNNDNPYIDFISVNKIITCVNKQFKPQQCDFLVFPPSNGVLLLNNGYCVPEQVLNKRYEQFKKECDTYYKALDSIDIDFTVIGSTYKDITKVRLKRCYEGVIKSLDLEQKNQSNSIFFNKTKGSEKPRNNSQQCCSIL